MEFAKDEATRQQVRLLIVTQDIDRPVLMPPGVPAARLKLMRDAFNATMVDPAFRVDIDKLRLTLDWVRGEEVANTLARAFAMPADIVAAAKETMAPK
jgi:tripartite-type tricarboxylate transporter receptor subunit TctC